MADAPRTFALHRDKDITGASGTGVVALGTMFPDGTTVIRWLGDRPSTVVWSKIGHAHAVHGHDGATRFVWFDQVGDRMARIAAAHHKDVVEQGLTSGLCAECDREWPCPTYVWAATARDAGMATWDPADDEPEETR